MKNRFLFVIGIIVSLVIIICAILSFRVTPTEATSNQYNDLKMFSQVLAIVQSQYVDKVSPSELIINATKGMVNSLDPHSAFMTPQEYKDLQVSTTGEFGGIGTSITLKDGLITVVTPIEDTPAYKAGIKAGDIILQINNKSTLGMSLDEAVKLLRGKVGTEVRLVIGRKNEKKPLIFNVKREIIHIKSVDYKDLDGTGYIRIIQFQEGTTKAVENALNSLQKKGIKGLVIDLRDNPGGLLTEAIGVSNLFVNKGVIVSIKGRNKNDDQVFYAKDEKVPHMPIAVLINSGTASAAEIVAGCLKDHKTAVIVGTRSFGKGSVQSIIPLEDGYALRLTTAKYYTPDGHSIQAVGIVPNVEVKPAKVESEDFGYALREENLINHLTSNETVQAKPEEIIKEPQTTQDFQLLTAINIIKAQIAEWPKK
jgi:carboxyl-terminal processing protease